MPIGEIQYDDVTEGHCVNAIFTVFLTKLINTIDYGVKDHFNSINRGTGKPDNV